MYSDTIFSMLVLSNFVYEQYNNFIYLMQLLKIKKKKLLTGHSAFVIVGAIKLREGVICTNV